jgi:hypothetical protein
MRLKKIMPVLIATLFSVQASGQSVFYGSGLLKFFNRGEYQTAVDSIQAWTARASADQEIGLYYAGESRYNLGLSGRDRSQFEKALSAFTECLQRIPSRDDNPNIFDNASIKKAWTLFRLSETGAASTEELEKIRQQFRASAAAPDDSLRGQALYMTGETSLRLAAAHRLKMSMLEQSTFGQKAIEALAESKSAFQSVIGSKAAARLRTASVIRIQDADFEHAALYGSMSENVFRNVSDPLKKASAVQTALELFSRIHPSSLADSLPYQAKPVLAYAGLMTSLHRYLISGTPADKQALTREFDQANLRPFASEQILAKGLRDSRDMSDNAALRDNEAFVNTTAVLSQALQPAFADIPEAQYWTGRLQAVANMAEAGESFRKFLAVTGAPADDARFKALREDAGLQLLSMRMEKAAEERGTSALAALKADLGKFLPETVSLREKRDELLLLTGVLLDPKKVWQNLSGSPDARLNELFKIIGNLLARSNQVVGQERRTLLNKVQPLFEFTQSRRPEETRYYQGLYRFLDAEIQVKGKVQKFREAAEWMKNAGGDFKLEGRYLRARSLLAADDYPNSREIFIGLINESKSVRAAYFLGEIFRMERNVLASRRCYDAVMRKTQDKEGGDLWFNAALAADRSVAAIHETAGDDAGALSGVRLEEIQFPERWMRGDEIAMEQFVETVYQKIQYLQEGLAFFTCYGIPKRSVYPSVFQPGGPRFNASTFGDFTAGISEKTGTVTSTLVFNLIFPEGGSRTASVRLNGQPIELDSEGSFQKTFTIGDTAQIRVTSEGYYPVSERILFVRPRQTLAVIPLVPYLSFRKIETGGTAFVRFPERYDANGVFFDGGQAALSSTQLYKTFQSNVMIRDFTYSKMHQGIVAVQARPARLMLFRSDANLSVEEELRTIFPDTSNRLVSPEGVAADSRGFLYVVDWAQHKILVFRPDGFFLRAFGGFGENTAEDAGKPARFNYPSRIAIAEDKDGVLVQGERYHCPLELFVSDRNGVHFIDEQGNYLSTVLYSPTEKGAFSALVAEGYGAACKLSVYNRRTGEVQRFGGEPQTVK